LDHAFNVVHNMHADASKVITRLVGGLRMLTCCKECKGNDDFEHFRTVKCGENSVICGDVLSSSWKMIGLKKGSAES
jgi:hypothetical protein